MKKQRYIVEIEMPNGDFISAGWLKDLIQADCDMEDEGRNKVTVQETSPPSNLDEAAEEFYPDFSDSIASKAAVDSMRDAFKAGAEWMAGQGMIVKGLLYGGNLGIPDNIPEEFYIDKQEEVIVQIRKK